MDQYRDVSKVTTSNERRRLLLLLRDNAGKKSKVDRETEQEEAGSGELSTEINFRHNVHTDRELFC